MNSCFNGSSTTRVVGIKVGIAVYFWIALTAAGFLDKKKSFASKMDFLTPYFVSNASSEIFSKSRYKLIACPFGTEPKYLLINSFVCLILISPAIEITALLGT